MSDTVQKIKDKLSIVDVVQGYVKLTKAGKYWKGLSPFNKEKTPSFFVSPDRGLFHCFSTGKGGDMFTFVEEMERVDFKGALRILAEKAGVEIEKIDPAKRDERERLFSVLESASEYFKKNLGTMPSALQYLKERGLTDASISFWNIGYASNGWQELHGALTKLGFTELELERAGLVKRPDANDGATGAPRFYDRFRGRIMFPIRDSSGRVIAFSGRIFEDDAKHPQAKYLNSPETEVFDKSRALYGLYEGKESLRGLNAALLVEGQFDLILAHQAGYRNAVATSGTAFTENHVEVLKRFCPNLVIAYDGDRAGIAAAGRAASIALSANMNTKIATFPAGMDPADVIHTNPQDFKDVVKGARHVVEFYLNLLKDAKYDPRTFKLEVTRTVLPYIALIENRVDRAHFTKLVSEELDVPESAVATEISRLGTKTAEISKSAVVQSEPFLTRGDALSRLITGIARIFKERGEEALYATALSALKEASISMSDDAKETDPASVFEADLFLERYADAPARDDALNELYGELKRVVLHEKYREALANLRRAEKAGNTAESDELMKHLQSLASLMH